MPRPKILFFARGYQADYFPTLQSDAFEAVFVTLTRKEKAKAEQRGVHVEACFEAEFDTLTAAPVPAGYLATSLMADRFLGRFSITERADLLGRMIAFWTSLLDAHSPVAVVNELVAIEISEVLLIEARRRDIRYLAAMNCVVDDWFYWLADPLTLTGAHLELPQPDDAAIAAARDYVQQLHASDYKPFYVKNLSGRWALRPLAVGLARWLLWQWRIRASSIFHYEDYREEYGKRLGIALRSLFLRYDRLEDIPADVEVVFYPLHQEPEATLNYMSAFYANQVGTIENILKCLTPQQVLVVKEHPVDKGALLRPKFHAVRKACSGLYFLPAEVHGRQVLRRAARVVTLTSTVGWEAAAIGRTVYVLGQIFYDHFKGVQRISGFEALRAKLHAPAPGSPATSADLEDFVARMMAASYPGNPFPHAGLYSDENRAKVLHAITDAALG